MKPLIAWVFVGLITAPSCGVWMQSQNPVEPLVESVQAFSDGLRWRHYTSAAKFVPVRERGMFLEERNELDSELRITHYELTRVNLSRDRSQATVHVKYVWHTDREGVVRRTVSKQRWERTGKRWYLAVEERIRGKEMPGLAEPVGKAQSSVGS